MEKFDLEESQSVPEQTNPRRVLEPLSYPYPVRAWNLDAECRNWQLVDCPNQEQTNGHRTRQQQRDRLHRW